MGFYTAVIFPRTLSKQKCDTLPRIRTTCQTLRRRQHRANDSHGEPSSDPTDSDVADRIRLLGLGHFVPSFTSNRCRHDLAQIELPMQRPDDGRFPTTSDRTCNKAPKTVSQSDSEHRAKRLDLRRYPPFVVGSEPLADHYTKPHWSGLPARVNRILRTFFGALMAQPESCH